MTKRRTDRPGYQSRIRANGTTAHYWNPKRACKAAPKNLALTKLPDGIEQDEIVALCQKYTDDLKAHLANKNRTPTFDGTIESLVHMYKITPTSSYKRLAHSSRTRDYDPALKVIVETVGKRRVDKLRGSDFRRWYDQWLETRGHRTAHSCIRKLRTALSHGLAERFPGCAEARQILSIETFAQPRPRNVMLCYEHALAVVDLALKHGRNSIALTQALQWDTAIRRIDFIGEWVPREPGDEGGIVHGRHKWIGPMANVISKDLVLSIISSKTEKLQVHDLKHCPMVMQVLNEIDLPKVGPLIICERTGLPYFQSKYATEWRIIANDCGIPKYVWSADTRAGALSDAHAATGSTEKVRDFATHSNIKVTKAYIRNDGMDQNTEIAVARNSMRNTPKTDL